MEKIFFVLVILNLLGCRSKLEFREAHIAEEIIVESLTALNLSEDMNELSTHNDKVLLLFTILKKESNQFKVIYNQMLGRFSFNKNGTNLKINKSIQLPSNNSLTFINSIFHHYKLSLVIR